MDKMGSFSVDVLFCGDALVMSDDDSEGCSFGDGLDCLGSRGNGAFLLALSLMEAIFALRSGVSGSDGALLNLLSCLRDGERMRGFELKRRGAPDIIYTN